MGLECDGILFMISNSKERKNVTGSIKAGLVYLRSMKGIIKWIGVRPERKAPLHSVPSVYADRNDGLTGDHDTKPHRQITIISREALAAVAQTMGVLEIDPADTRRNILISGMDFNIESGTRIRLGEAVIEITGPCLPCERMNETLGDGGRMAMADAGGLTAMILSSGQIAVGDGVEIIASGSEIARPQYV